MRKCDVIKGLALIIMTCMLYACHDGKVSAPALLLAEEIMEEHPDSALTILKQIPDSLYKTDQEQALYCLLLTEAMTKTSNMPMTDSLISIATRYYDKTNDIESKAKAWFYRGRVSHELLYKDKALECYLKAVSYADQTENNKLLALIYNYLGNLYRQLEIYDEAIKNTKLASGYCVKQNDTLNMPFAIRDIGRAYLFKKEVDSALYYFNQAFEVAKLYRNKVAEASILNDMGTAYRQKKDYQSAIRLIQSSIPLKTEQQQYSSYLSLVRLYCHLDKVDSLTYYLKLAEKDSNIYVQEGVNYYRYKLSMMKKDYENAIFYNMKYQVLRDSINRKAQKDEIMRLKYDHNQKQLKKELEQKAAQERFLYICCILLLILVIVLVGYFHIRSRWTHEQTLRLQEKKIQHEKELRQQSIEQILQNQEQIELNKQKLIDKDLDLQAAQKDLIIYNNKLLKAENDLISLKRQERELRDRLFHQTQFSDRIRCSGVDIRKKDIDLQPFSMKEYSRLVKKIDEFYDDFSKRLEIQYPKLKERDIEVCCLIKAGARTGNIAALIPMTPNAVTKKKKQILDKMELKGITLDDFLASF